jgi:hypothetical protein
LAPTTLKDYKDAIYDSVALLLRYKHVIVCRKVDVGQRRRGKEDEMEIDLHLSSQAVSAMNQLYSFLIKVKEDEEIPQNELAIHVHLLLLGMLTSQASSRIKVGSLFEFVTALRTYLGPERGFRPASLPSKMCSMFAYGMRTIVVHASRLGGGHVPYLKPIIEKSHKTVVAGADAVRPADGILELEELVEDEGEDGEDEDEEGEEEEEDALDLCIGPEDVTQAQMHRLAVAADLAQVHMTPVDKPNSSRHDEDPEDELIPDPYADDNYTADATSDTNPVDPFTEMLKDDLLT